MKHSKEILCLSVFILKFVTSTISSPIDDLNFGNIQKFINKEFDDSTYIDQLPTNFRNSKEDYTSICWAESLIINENKITKNKTISKSYSILLDSPEKLKQLHTEIENASCVEILEHNSTPKKAVNFTITKETDEYVIKEHKTLFCGAGPVLSHHFIVWPKLNRRQIEISINPLSSTKWKNCMENNEAKDSFTQGSIPSQLEKAPSRGESETIRNINLDEAPEDEAENLNSKNLKNGHVDLTSSDEDEDEDDDISIDTGAAHVESVDEAQLIGIKPETESNNILLRRHANCTVDNLGVCKNLIETSNNILGYNNNSSQAVIGKWFFLDNTDAHLDRQRSFMLKVKIIVNMENTSKNDEKNTELVIEEDCLYVIPKN